MRTPKKPTSRKLVKHSRTKTLQSFISCLYYLHNEAEKSGEQDIAIILKETVCKIDLAAKHQHQRVQLIDTSLFDAMNFLHEMALLAPSKRSDFMKICLEMGRVVFKNDGSVDRAVVQMIQ